MALTRTSLAAACGVDDLVLRCTAVTGAVVGGVAIVGDEYMFITGITSPNVYVRGRGSYGGYAKPHLALAPVTFALTSDIPDPAPGQTVPKGLDSPNWDVREAAVNGDFDPGAAGGKNLTRNTEVLIVKATAWTQTITAPNFAQDGLTVRFISTTAAAHVITYAAGFAGNAGASDIATFAATINGVLGIRAQAGTWAIVEISGVTVA
jgi:hypothetical protein